MPGTILIADGVATRRISLITTLNEAYYDVRAVTRLAELETVLDGEMPDLVLVAAELVEADGFAACHRLLDRLQGVLVPLVLVGDGPVAQQLRAIQAGVDEYLCPPWGKDVVIARLRNIIRRKHSTDELLMRYATAEDLGLACALDQGALGQDRAPLNLVLAAGPGASDQMLAGEIRRKLPGAVVHLVHSASEAQMAVKTLAPDVTVVTDGVMDGAGGLKLVAQLRGLEASRHAAVLAVVACDSIGITALGADIGASDFLVRTGCSDRLVPKVEALARRARRAASLRQGLQTGLRLAVTDTLTQLSNRRYLMHHLPKQIRAAQAAGQAYAGMILDLDRFKAVNDTHGHAAGDVVLKEAAGRIRACLREGDLVARLGGEEFFVGLSHTNNTSARRIAERIRTRVAAAPFKLPDGARLGVTVSVGVAWVKQADVGAEALMERADQALYRSKSQGRNRVTFDARAVA
ncbi:MAG: diguanylate cyclase [Pseudomonadota bacterium]